MYTVNGNQYSETEYRLCETSTTDVRDVPFDAVDVEYHTTEDTLKYARYVVPRAPMQGTWLYQTIWNGLETDWQSNQTDQDNIAMVTNTMKRARQQTMDAPDHEAARADIRQAWKIAVQRRRHLRKADKAYRTNQRKLYEAHQAKSPQQINREIHALIAREIDEMMNIINDDWLADQGYHPEIDFIRAASAKDWKESDFDV